MEELFYNNRYRITAGDTFYYCSDIREVALQVMLWLKDNLEVSITVNPEYEEMEPLSSEEFQKITDMIFSNE
jgi:hypothetical protein